MKKMDLLTLALQQAADGTAPGTGAGFTLPDVLRPFLTKEVWAKVSTAAWTLFFSDLPDTDRAAQLASVLIEAVELADDAAALIPNWGPLARGILDSAPVDALEAQACRTVAETIVRALKPVAIAQGGK